MKTNLKKPLALGSFLLLLAGFVTFKAGAFDPEMETKPYQKNSLPTDTPEKKKEKPRMLSTSKSMVIYENPPLVPSENDSTAQADSSKTP